MYDSSSNDNRIIGLQHDTTGSVIDLARDSMNFHQSTREFRKDDPEFQADFQMYLEKYAVNMECGEDAEVPME